MSEPSGAAARLRAVRRMATASALAAVSLVAAALPPAGALPPPLRLGVSSDFDGDGFADAVFAAPREGLPDAPDAGAVHVLYGSGGGLTARDDVLITQTWLGEAAEAGDLFGLALTSADFDFDGYADLVVGAPFEDLLTEDEGSATVIYGSPGGLTPARVQTFTQDTPGIANEAGGGDQFGGSFGTGDFDGDQYPDLAIGAREESPDEEREGAGAAHVLYGSPSGLVAEGSGFFMQGLDGLADAPEPLDRFGIALEGADLNGDGFDDLAIGAHGEDLGLPGEPGSVADAGAVHVLWGSASGVTAAGSDVLVEGAGGVPGAAEDVDLFGSELASGDFDDDGRADLAVGVFAEDLHRALDGGAAVVLYGAAAAGFPARGRVWSQNARGIRDGAEEGDNFAVALAAGDLDGDGFDDLVAGVQGEDVAEVTDAGAVAVLFGSATGLTADRDRLLSRATEGVPGDPTEFEFVGTDVAAADLGGSPTGAADLLAGTRRSFPRADLAGSTVVLYGLAASPAVGGAQEWSQAAKGVLGVPEPFDLFGIVLRAA